MAGAAIYARVCKTLPLGLLLASGTILSSILAALFLYYESHNAIIITAVNGLGGTLAAGDGSGGLFCGPAVKE